MQSLPNSLRIGVIRGGTSPLYDISIKTGGAILEALNETHKPIDIFISKDGVWHMGGIEKSPEKILKNVDVVWNALHGKFGEDGKVQELLSHLGVPHTGSEKYASAVVMNKWLTKEHLKDLGIKTPLYEIVRQTDDLKVKSKEIFSTIPHPMIVKPVNGGSSLGIAIVNNYIDLYKALYDVLSSESDAIVEEYIKGKDASVFVVDNFRNKNLYVFPPVEVKHQSQSGYYDYDSKYNRNVEIVSPGVFSEKEKKEIERVAALVHEKLGLRHYAKSDFVINPKRGVYFLEVNTLPHLDKDSLFASSLSSVGVALKDFVHHVLLETLNNK